MLAARVPLAGVTLRSRRELGEQRHHPVIGELSGTRRPIVGRPAGRPPGAEEECEQSHDRPNQSVP